MNIRRSVDYTQTNNIKLPKFRDMQIMQNKLDSVKKYNIRVTTPFIKLTKNMEYPKIFANV